MFMMFSQKFQKPLLPSVIISAKIVEGWVRVDWRLDDFLRVDWGLSEGWLRVEWKSISRNRPKPLHTDVVHDGIQKNFLDMIQGGLKHKNLPYLRKLIKCLLRVEWGLTEGWLRVEDSIKIDLVSKSKTVPYWCGTWRDTENFSWHDTRGLETQKSTIFEKIDQMSLGGCLRVEWGLAEGCLIFWGLTEGWGLDKNWFSIET